ncbi:MAG: hypothetical protein WED10_07910 [Brumimicrobium sp.]
MSKMNTILLTFFFFTGLISCTTAIEDPPDKEPEEKETYFKPGEYGGEPLPGSEHLLWISPSPDGEKIAVIRRQTPEKLDPFNQLWIMDRNGSNAELITYNIQTVDWHPTENKLALSYNPNTTAYSYLFTLNLKTDELKLWNSKEEQFFEKYTSASNGWFSDGKNILMTVNGKAYQQEYERGIYTINTIDSTHTEPHKILFAASALGNNDQWAVGLQYTTDNLSSNRAFYNLESNEFQWLTSYHTDSDSLRRYTGYPVINPSGPEIILSKFVDNAWQLFQVNQFGDTVRQLTDLGGERPRWSRGVEYFTFIRDTHKGEGAHYIPFKYNFTTGEEEPLWLNLPDSVPVFPDVSTQDPIHLIDHVP